MEPPAAAPATPAVVKTAREGQEGPSKDSWARAALGMVLAGTLLAAAAGILLACLAQPQEFPFEHVAELHGLPFHSSLLQSGSDYCRALTPLLEQLFLSSFRNSSLEGSCSRCSILQYRKGNNGSSVVVHFCLWFSVEPPSPSTEEAALRRGLEVALGDAGLALPGFGALSSATITRR
ncbi:transmembrane protease serine 9-like [Anolis sagrei]|uniref:transmembrane protease serine 9-like n=1 Tax=Anolis sagrei TaxID=38937 RepID=UPI0035224063